MLKKILPVFLLVVLLLGASKKGPLTKFSVKNLKGETVTEEIFSSYDITMVNIWATWCGPCVHELPEIQKLYATLPSNANIISFCLDAGDRKKSFKQAEKLVKSANMQFQVLLPDRAFASAIMGAVNSTGIPTTIFVDKKGNIVGAPIIGAPANVIQYYRSAIEDRLRTQKGK